MNQLVYHLGLIGYPLGHSRSPQLHRAALEAIGLQGEYTLFPIPPQPEREANEEIQQLLLKLRQGELQGLNVTIPHKASVMPYLDHLSPVAQAVGAVNTIYMSANGVLAGDNTDVHGFLKDVQSLTGSDVGKALVLGAGGSARAVTYALAMAGWDVRVLARREAQAQELVQTLQSDLAGKPVQAGLLSEDSLAQLSPGNRLVVNATPVGMYPNVEESPWPESVPLPSGAVIYDLVYNPDETMLVKRARQAGLQADTGAGMLIAQAALAFMRWIGREPPAGVMETAFYGDEQ